MTVNRRARPDSRQDAHTWARAVKPSDRGDERSVER